MKPFLLKVDVSPEQSFRVRNKVNPLDYNQWHYHPELELTFIQKGSGIRFVGDNIENFQAGDLILLGENLPHFWRSDEAQEEQACEALVVQFLADFWGNSFMNLPELALLKDLFQKAKRGIRIRGESQQEVSTLMQELSTVAGLERILLLLRLLQVIAHSPEITFLCSSGFHSSLSEAETKRMSDIHTYTLANFSSKIKLEEVAALVHLTPNAFCRYFKTHARKTFSQFLLEIRVGHACKLLMEGKLPVGQICLDSGFQNFSNFNRYFKAITKLTPQEYQRLHKGGK
ncbi:AraC family transcriptional regulator [Pontibacter qinzhouensis]|uniref:AraC family transcriptional regulator n=1 Tax=Pontibacter qinzhouensis TaxID=2603253 RepID=A0A5C8KBN7_9BACT|nr:AraC family transcriptional regulator [Pontibacter qinzhouensis]TXK47158.1 AraC family transcriptional regulator [Pontibacter qinzhouensis]